MSKARLVITAVVVEGRTPAEVIAEYGVSRSWLYELLARYKAEGDAAFAPRSKRPYSSPRSISDEAVELIVADRSTESHQRVRTDRLDESGCVTLRVNGRLHHIGVGRTHARTHILLLVHDLEVRIIDAATGELLRELTIDPDKDYQGTGRPPGPPPGRRQK